MFVHSLRHLFINWNYKKTRKLEIKNILRCYTPVGWDVSKKQVASEPLTPHTTEVRRSTT